jgi:hypothetical protein
MTRRDFGALVSSMLGVALMVKPQWLDGAVTVKPPVRGAHHIQNRRLFSFAEGKIKLAKWERQHIHECEVCQQMLCVLIRQATAYRI